MVSDGTGLRPELEKSVEEGKARQGQDGASVTHCRGTDPPSGLW